MKEKNQDLERSELICRPESHLYPIMLMELLIIWRSLSPAHFKPLVTSAGALKGIKESPKRALLNCVVCTPERSTSNPQKNPPQSTWRVFIAKSFFPKWQKSNRLTSIFFQHRSKTNNQANDRFYEKDEDKRRRRRMSRKNAISKIRLYQ